MNGAFSTGFNTGFNIGVNTMANLDVLTINKMTEITAVPVVSGTVLGLSGLLRDEEFCLVIDTNNFGAATGTFTIYAGDYQNAADYTVTLAQDKFYALGQFQGAQFRQDDGSVNVACNQSGNIYAFTK